MKLCTGIDATYNPTLLKDKPTIRYLTNGLLGTTNLFNETGNLDYSYTQ